MQTAVSSASGVSETAARPPSPVADGPLLLPSPTCLLLQAVTFLACSLDSSPGVPAVVLDYCIFQDTIL